MLILSQERKQIVNALQMHRILVLSDPCEEESETRFVCAVSNDETIVLGGYKNEERAMEVLLEIAKFYSECAMQPGFKPPDPGKATGISGPSWVFGGPQWWFSHPQWTYVTGKDKAASMLYVMPDE